MSKTKEKKAAYLKTDDPSYLEVQELANKHGVKMEVLFSDEKFDDEVIEVLYPKLPKMLKMFTTKETFKKGYVLKRGVFLQQFKAIEKF